MEKENAQRIPYCPVFYPTMKEFQNFQKYIEDCEATLTNEPVFKVIPPREWVSRKAGYDNLNLVVKKPIEQNVHGTKGVYELVHFVKESKSVEKFQKQARTSDKFLDNKSIEDIEKLFWKTLKHSAPIYGADIPGSLFDKNIPWNLAEIDTLLTKGLGSTQILGVNSPYIYFGAWKTMFGWHKEDMDLYSINYLHCGKPKFWYAVDLDCNAIFEAFVRSKFPDYFKECPEFIRHKTTLVHPELLLEKGVKLTKVVEEPNQFVVTRAAAYHSGFNVGFNVAEAVNFAVPRWMSIGQKAKVCNCVKDSVRINMSSFQKNIRTDGKEEVKRRCVVEAKSMVTQAKVMGKRSKKVEEIEKIKPRGSKSTEQGENQIVRKKRELKVLQKPKSGQSQIQGGSGKLQKIWTVGKCM